MRCTIFAPVACPALSYLSTWSHKGMIFGDEKKLLNTKCMLWFSLEVLSETFLIIRRIQRDIIINAHSSSCTVHFTLFRFSWNFNFLDRFSKNFSNINFHENPSSGSRIVPCGQTDGQTVKTKPKIYFRNFANTPEECWLMLLRECSFVPCRIVLFSAAGDFFGLCNYW